MKKTLIVEFKEKVDERVMDDIMTMLKEMKGIVDSCRMTEREVEIKSSFRTYDLPGQCGLCGSFHCSGNCFK